MSNRLDKIEHLPEFIALTQARRKIMWPLSIITIASYFALILTIAFSPSSLATPISNGTTSLGVVLGLGVIILCFIVTGIYVYYANRVIEPLVEAAKKRIGELK